jgi:hypothetical protein
LSPELAALVSGGRVAESLMNVPPGYSVVGVRESGARSERRELETAQRWLWHGSEGLLFQ